MGALVSFGICVGLLALLSALGQGASGLLPLFGMVIMFSGLFVIIFLLLVAYDITQRVTQEGRVRKGLSSTHTEKAQIGMLYNYECRLCGYEWEWRSNTPRPVAIVRPELIARGAQKLEEDEKAAAAAAWWLEQQRKQQSK
jgi:hypothetical protein